MATLNPNPAEELLPQDLSQAAETTVPDAPAPSLYTITQADINSNLNLQKQGVMSGDQVDKNTGKLVRNYSSSDDAVQDLKFITEEHIMHAPDLADKYGAEAGDVIVNGKLVKTGNSDTIKQAKYAWDTTLSGEEMLTKWSASALSEDMGGPTQLMSLMGTGVRQTPDEFFGAGFSEADADAKRQMINRKYERIISERYGRYFKADPWSLGGIAGTVGKVLTDPLAYAGGAVLRAGKLVPIATEAAVGAGYSVGEDVTTDSGEIDPAKAALYAGIGALGTALPISISHARDKSASKLITEAEKTANEHIKYGGSQQSAAQKLDEVYGLGKIAKAERRSGKRVKLAKYNTQSGYGGKSAEASKYLDELIAKDPIGAASKFPTLRKGFAMLRTEVGMRSPAIQRLMDKHDRVVNVVTEAYLQRGQKFLKEYLKPRYRGGMSDAQRQKVTQLMYNGDFKGAKAILPKSLRGQVFDDFVKLYDELGDELLGAGHVFNKEKNYVHRGIKDYGQLRRLMNKEQLSELDKALEAYAKNKGTSINTLTQDVKDRIANQVIRGRRWDPAANRLSQTKKRSIKVIDEKLMPAYDDLNDSFHRYVRTSVNDIYTRQLFARGGKPAKGDLDLDKSIGELINDYSNRGLIKEGAADELSEMVQARFGASKPQLEALRITKNVGYTTTIGNMVSAILQLADLSTSVVINGIGPTTRGLIDAAVGGIGKDTKNMKLIELGIKEVSNDLTASTGRTQKLLDWSFKWSGFQRLDRLGKEAYVNAAFRKNINLIKTAKGEDSFRKKWGQYYGDEINDIVNEFKALNNRPDFKPSDVPDSIKAHMLSELMDVQPVGRSNVPQAYLEHPNGRIVYMLKMWTLKQYDIMRRNVVHEWKRGNKVKATKFAAAYALTVGLANGSIDMLRDVMQGRDVRIEELPVESFWGLTSVFGFSKYGVDRYLDILNKSGEVKNVDQILKNYGMFVLDQALPPTPAAFDLGKAATSLMNDDESILKSTRSLPIIGPILYGWFGGGAEAWNERQGR